MTTTPVQAALPEEIDARANAVKVPGALVWSGLFFALLQSVCTFFAAANGLRLALGLGSLVLSAGAGSMVDRFHAEVFRIPMLGFALAASLLNLAILAQVRHLRGRSSSQWRQAPPSRRKLRMERLQIVLSLATLVLVTVEEILHYHYSGHL